MKNKKLSLKKGALSRQLGIPIRNNIPSNLLRAIKNAPIGVVISYRINGKYPGKVTKLLKKRAVFALNIRRRR
ncbi:MAG: hypothetical protein GXO79_11425 [Chlorobi bacterium]|nr:hypothetical protein [Chlorobiota bacterium]